MVLEEKSREDISGSTDSQFLTHPASQTQCNITTWTKTAQSRYKVSENTHAEDLSLKMKAVTELDDWFTICQYKREEPKNTKMSILILFFFQRFDCFDVK